MEFHMEWWDEDIKVADAFQSKYPKLFIKRGKPMHSMNGGIGIGKGWYPLLKEICQMIESYRDRCPEIHFLQIKEKFARLTVYIGFNNASKELCQEIFNKTEEVCDRSALTCEDCGATEEVVVSSFGGFWVRAICKSCIPVRGNKTGKMTNFEAANKILNKE